MLMIKTDKQGIALVSSDFKHKLPSVSSYST